MMPILSAHAASRMLDRCIDARKIDAALADGVCLGHRCGVAVYARERLRVLVDVHGVIVTVWRVRRRNPKREIRIARREKKRLLREWRK